MRVSNTVLQENTPHFAMALITELRSSLLADWLVIRTQTRSSEIFRKDRTRVNVNANKGRNVAQSDSEIKGSV